jgi:DNA-binding NarL/FixJ family response regulator
VTITVAVGQFGYVIGRGLLETLEDDPALDVLGSGLDQGALEQAVALGNAEVVVLDEDSAARPRVARGLYAAGSSVGLVVLAHRPTRRYATRMIALGVNVCLSTESSAAEIGRAVRHAADGEHVFVSMSALPSEMAGMARARSLTPREQDVLALLGRGRKNAEIARALNISAETARTHTQHVYRKLGVSSRGELRGIER